MTGLFERALCFAAERHAGQKRKACDGPYFLHPMEVATIVGTMTDDEETLAAALLHDTVEDAGVTLEEIRALFGKRVSLLVMTETEDKRPDLPEVMTWRIRKEETLGILQNTKDLSVKMMWLGDKLSNVRSFYRLYLREGLDMWKHFNQTDPREQKWYYDSIRDALYELKDTDAYREFTTLTSLLFENAKEE